jgi:DNA modification methylase
MLGLHVMDWFTSYRDELRREIAAIARMDGGKVAIDIRARTRDRKLARKYVSNMQRMLRELDQRRISEKEFCASLGPGHSYSQMHRRMQLLPEERWQRYLKRRRDVANNGVFGLPYAVYLALGERATSSQPLRTPPADGTVDDRVQLLTDDALTVLRGMETGSVNFGVSSPPYWPARRMYVPGDMHQIGFEPTLEEYLDHVVWERFRELKRVLRDDGVLFVVIDDAISQPAKAYKLQTSGSRAEVKVKTLTSFRTQNTTHIRKKGNWLNIPAAFEDAMVADGWIIRDRIILNKGNLGRKESSDNRTRHNYEWLLMFTKALSYHYVQDAMREPLSQPITAASLTGGRGYSKGGVIRGDFREPTWRILSNPLGRICGAVWDMPVGYAGSHSAAFPEQLVRNCLSLACRSNSLVIDIFGGSGTTALVAWKMGHRAISIDRNLDFTAEAKQRLLTAEPDDELAANDNEPTAVVAGD